MWSPPQVAPTTCAAGSFIALVSKEEYVAPALCLPKMMRAVGSICPFHIVVDDRDRGPKGITAASQTKLKESYGEDKIVSLAWLIGLAKQVSFSIDAIAVTTEGRRLLHGGTDSVAASTARLLLWALPTDRFPKLVYIDLDMVILKNIDALLQVPLPQGGVAAATGCVMKHTGADKSIAARMTNADDGVSKVLLPQNGYNFNAGLLVFRPSLAQFEKLVNVQRWMSFPWKGYYALPSKSDSKQWYDICAPANCYSEKCLPAIRMFPNSTKPMQDCRIKYNGRIGNKFHLSCEPKYTDQSVLNTVYGNKWHKLSKHYNMVPAGSSSSTIPPNVSVVHFAGEPKPWAATFKPWRLNASTSRSSGKSGSRTPTTVGAKATMARHWRQVCDWQGEGTAGRQLEEQQQPQQPQQPQPPTPIAADDPVTAEFKRASAALNAQDDAAIDSLFERYKCKHAYLDMGTNLGVQIRKLYEPEKYPGARAFPHYQRMFGPQPWCSVCTIGFEPNPRHADRLNSLEKSLREAGAPVHIFKAAVGDGLGTLSFQAEGGEMPWVRSLHLNAAARAGVAAYETSTHASGKGGGAFAAVRTIDLARVVNRVHKNLKKQNGGKRGDSRILMKLDVEGSEERVMLHLVRMQTACLIDRVMVEWHKLSMFMPWLKTMKGMPIEARAVKARDETTAAGIDALEDVTILLRQTLIRKLNGTAFDCRTELLGADDETHYKDRKPLPEKTLCNAP